MLDELLIIIALILALIVGFVLGNFANGDLKIIYKDTTYGIERCITP